MQEPLVHIFSTNIRSEFDKEFLTTQLRRNPSVSQITFDLTDREKVLRVESSTLSSRQIINILSNYGYSCKEMTD